MQMQGQAYVLGADQQTAMGLAGGYSRSVNGGDCKDFAHFEGPGKVVSWDAKPQVLAMMCLQMQHICAGGG